MLKIVYRCLLIETNCVKKKLAVRDNARLGTDSLHVYRKYSFYDAEECLSGRA